MVLILMPELFERERKIITILLTVCNPLPEVRNQPQNVKEQLIREALRAKGLQFNEAELVELVNLITKETQTTVQSLFGFLQKRGIDWKALDFKSLLGKR